MILCFWCLSSNHYPAFCLLTYGGNQAALRYPSSLLPGPHLHTWMCWPYSHISAIPRQEFEGCGTQAVSVQANDETTDRGCRALSSPLLKSQVLSQNSLTKLLRRQVLPAIFLCSFCPNILTLHVCSINNNFSRALYNLQRAYTSVFSFNLLNNAIRWDYYFSFFTDKNLRLRETGWPKTSQLDSSELSWDFTKLFQH